MKKICLFIFTVLFTFSAHAEAQTNEGVNSFKQDKDAWRRKDDIGGVSNNEVIQKIKDSVNIHGLNNILHSEQLFCYTVDKAPKGYKGYTIDGMAITGFCGIMKEENRDIFVQAFFQREESTSNIMAKCVIEPKMMLRFIKGVDYTDVLLSAPCHSFSIFYGGKVKSFNAEPSAAIIETFINAYSNKRVDFISPALLEQLMPIGIAKTPEQKALIKEKSGDIPVRNWNTKTPKSIATEKPSNQQGWNKLKK